ncbi:MAG TPA: GntR family transcriptional regulator [Stellaceae bacterium]|nr:GntR family transcriptional regulator [Stellaceae bacterium]
MSMPSAAPPAFEDLPADGLIDAHPRHARLAQRIVDAAVDGGWPAGQKVTEEELARRFEVSRTPIRAALRLLTELGILVPGPRRGHVLARAGATLAEVSLSAPEPAEEQLHAALIRDRLAGRVAATQSQADLGRRYGVGLPTLQRVLSRMEQEGVIAREGWRWTFVPTLETGRSREASYELRLMLEPGALLLPGFRADPDSLRRLTEEHEALIGDLDHDLARRDPLRIFELDARFHETLAGFGGNPFVLNVVRQQNALRRLLELGTYDDRARVAAWCGEHLAILARLDEGNPAAASDLLRAHLLTARASTAGAALGQGAK